MPDATSTGGSGKRPSTPRFTQSDGVPFTANRRSATSIHAQRPVQGERVSHRALLAVRRDDVHLAERLERLGERGQPGRVDAVIVGDEDHRRHGLSDDR